ASNSTSLPHRPHIHTYASIVCWSIYSFLKPTKDLRGSIASLSGFQSLPLQATSMHTSTIPQTQMSEYARSDKPVNPVERLSLRGGLGRRGPSGRRQGKLIMTIETSNDHEDQNINNEVRIPYTSVTGQAPQSSSASSITSQVGKAAQQSASQDRSYKPSLTQADSETTQETELELEDPKQLKYRKRRLRKSGYNGNFMAQMSQEPRSCHGSDNRCPLMDRRSLGERHQEV
ncbi:hypothetical protein EV426DRAFT_682850, partial [Tirmania nivea]